MNAHRYFSNKCGGEGFRPNAGVCMTVFAVPLMIPGLTLTIVAFEDETGFSKFSPLHILGMTLLGLSVVLVTSAILLNINFKTRVAPDDNLHTVSTHEKIPREGNRGSVFSANTGEYAYKNGDLPVVFIPSLPVGSHVVQMDHISKEGDYKGNFAALDAEEYSEKVPQHVRVSSAVSSEGKCFSNHSFDDYSSTSSFDSYDSEDCSSGSYIISEEAGREVPLDESAMRHVQEIHEFHSFSTFKTGFLKKPVFNFKDPGSSKSRSFEVNSNALLHAVGNRGISLNDISNNNININFKGMENEELFFNSSNECLVNITENINASSNFTFDLQVQGHSPGSRKRLHGLSSEIMQASCDSIRARDFSSDENVTDSNSSVFCKEAETKTTANITPGGCILDDDLDQKPTSTSSRTWAQSPSTTRPHSFPSGTSAPGSSGTATSNFHSEKHAIRALLAQDERRQDMTPELLNLCYFAKRDQIRNIPMF